MVRHRLFVLLVLLVAGLALALARHLERQWDWSDSGRNRLHAETLEVLQTLEGPVEIEVFLEDYPVQRAALRDLLEKYRRARPGLSYRFTDPAREPQRARELGIVRTPTLLLRHGGREERLEKVDEAAISSALARLGRRGSGWIGAVTGHGEAKLHGQANFDLGDFGRLLEQQGYRVVDLDLAATRQLPGNLDLLVLAAPATELAPAEAERILRYLEGGGNLLWLADGKRPEKLAESLEVAFLPGTVVDAAAAELGIDTPTVAVARPAGEHPVTGRLNAPVLLPRAHALEHRGSGWKRRALLQSSPQSWNETGSLKGVIQRDPSAGEQRGPLPLALLLERNDQRVAVVGDADFLSNAFLGNGANRPFGLALVRWLTRNDRLVRIPPRQAPDRQLRWKASTLAATAGLFLAGLPLLLAATGLAVAWRRRRR